LVLGHGNFPLLVTRPLAKGGGMVTG
jgi:hypothetical protein